SANSSTGLHSVSSTPLCQSLHWPPLSVLHPPLPIPPLASTQCPPPLSANPSTGLHSVSSTPLCQSLHWPPLSVLHPSLPIPPLASTQCPPPLSANPSTGLHSVSSTPLCQSLHWPPLSCPPPLSANPSTGLHSVSSTLLCQSLHWPPLSVLHPSLPIPPLASTQCPPPPSANPSTGLHSVSSTPLCQSLHWLLIAQQNKFKILTLTYKAVHQTAPNYITDLISKCHPTRSLRSSQDLLLSSSLVSSSHARLQDFSRASPILWNSLPQPIRLSPTLLSFRRTLKTHLFREAYPPPA
ncbi:unnamed protein product, partial [Staurois parvus]